MIFEETKQYQLPNLLERERAEADYFSSPRILSYSGLKKLVEDPVDFYRHYILNIREDRHDKSTLEGSLTHLLLFEPSKFEDEYAITPKTMPSDNPKKVIFEIFKHHKAQLEADPSWSKRTLKDYENEVHEVLAHINLYQNLKDPNARFMKVADEKGTAFWEHLLFSEGKTVIDDETHEKAKANVDKIKSDVTVMELMGMLSFDPFARKDIRNEQELIAFPDDCPFGLRGYLDNLVVDHDKKEIRINDLKNTSKSFLTFRESIELYKYWIQVVIYHILVENVYGKMYPEYKRVFRFIVLDRSGTVGPYRVTDETLAIWQKRFEVEVLTPAKVHFEKRDFLRPSVLLTDKEIAL